MASVIRKLMRNIAKGRGRQQMAAGRPAMGTVRAGMHQKSEYEYQHGRMAEADEPKPETVEDGLDMPASLDAEIPPVEEEDDEITADIAEGEAAIETDEEILAETADPEAAENEEEAEVSEELGVRSKELPGLHGQLEVDYSGEKIPVFDPIISGAVDPGTPLVYDPQGGELKEIQEPLPGMERMGVAPYIPGAEASGNVPASEESDDLHIDFSKRRI